MKKQYIFGLLLLITLMPSSLYAYSTFRTYAPKSYVSKNGTTTITKNTVTGEVTSGVQTFTLEMLSTHKDTSSCYTVVQGNVYDLTLFANGHKGGSEAILSMCGHDATDAFMQAHGGQAKIMRMMTRFHIGIYN
jgi:cytochrome b involved in lipid metabolism